MMSSVRIEVACDDVFISSLCFPGNRESGRENKNPPENPAGFRKTDKIVQKSRRSRMRCHATRFSAAAAIISLVGLTSISNEILRQ
jgi:hypothetical protein